MRHALGCHAEEMTTRLPDRIETARLVLRHWTEDDVPALAEILTRNLERLRPWMPWVAHEPLSAQSRRDLVRTWRTQWAEGGDSVFGMFRDGAAIGSTGLHRRSTPGALELGYWVDAAAEGHGYVTEAVVAQTTAAFRQPGVEFVDVYHLPLNVRSRAVPAGLGFTDLGINEVRGEGVGLRQWRVTRTQWAARPHPVPAR